MAGHRRAPPGPRRRSGGSRSPTPSRATSIPPTAAARSRSAPPSPTCPRAGSAATASRCTGPRARLGDRCLLRLHPQRRSRPQGAARPSSPSARRSRSGSRRRPLVCCREPANRPARHRDLRAARRDGRHRERGEAVPARLPLGHRLPGLPERGRRHAGQRRSPQRLVRVHDRPRADRRRGRQRRLGRRRSRASGTSGRGTCAARATSSTTTRSGSGSSGAGSSRARPPGSTRASGSPARSSSSSTALAKGSAVRRYLQILRTANERGMRVMLTLNHFTLPSWVHDPLAVRAAFEGRGADDPVPEGLKRRGLARPRAPSTSSASTPPTRPGSSATRSRSGPR